MFSLKRLYVILLGLLLIVGNNILLSAENAPERQIELKSELIIIGNDSLMASVPPSFWKPITYGDVVGSSYHWEISQYDWNADMAYKIMFCESSGIKDKHNYSDATKDDSWGLFQINLYGNLADSRPSSEWLLVAENNIAYAYSIYKDYGWGAWLNCYKKIKGL